MGKPGKKLKKIFLILGITGAVYGGFKYLLPLVVPFLCAYLAALWMGPSVRYFERRLTIRLGGKERRIPAAVIGGVELLFMGAVLSWLFYLGSSRLLAQARLFMVRLPEWLSEADRVLTGLFLSLEEKMGLMPESLVGLVRELVRDASEAVRQASLPLLMTNSVSVLAWAVRAVVFLVLFFVAAVMTLEEMDEIREKKSGSIFHREFSVLGRRIASAGSAWFKTQLVIMAVTAMICTLGLTLLGNPYSVLLGLGIGLLDALPVFGTGAVLIPWGAFLLLEHQWWKGAVLLFIYGLCKTCQNGAGCPKKFSTRFPRRFMPRQMLRLMQSARRMTTDSRMLWSISGSPFLTEPTIPVMKRSPTASRSLLTPSPGFKGPRPRVT